MTSPFQVSLLTDNVQLILDALRSSSTVVEVQVQVSSRIKNWVRVYIYIKLYTFDILIDNALIHLQDMQTYINSSWYCPCLQLT